MGKGRKLTIRRATNWTTVKGCQDTAEALDIFADEIRTKNKASDQAVSDVVEAFLKMICLPTCPKTSISENTLSAATSGIAAVNEGVPSSVVDDLIANMLCNLCPPWPLCAVDMSQCVNYHTTKKKETTTT